VFGIFYKKNLVKGNSKMKRLVFMTLIIAILLMLKAGSVWSAVSLPTASFSGSVDTTAGVGTGELTINATISQVNYLDGTSTTVNGVVESLIGKDVVITGATRIGDYTFADATFSIIDGSFHYLSATLSNITLVACGFNWCLNPNLDPDDASTLNLTINFLAADATHPSQFIDELQVKMGLSSVIGIKMVLIDTIGSIEGDSISDISPGLVDGVPTTVEGPTVAKSIGYWKNHDEERYFFITNAISISEVFHTTTDLDASLAKKGKKSMVEKAEQQLAALLLNIAASLDPSTVLSPGELEILQFINPIYDTNATVGDALVEIEDVVNSQLDSSYEAAKDLADEINNRDN
jgi:hypothetical protein